MLVEILNNSIIQEAQVKLAQGLFAWNKILDIKSHRSCSKGKGLIF